MGSVFLTEGFMGAIVGAVLGGVLTGFFSWLLQRNVEFRSKSDQLRMLLISLMELRTQHEDEIPAIKDAILQDKLSRRINDKRQVYLQAADLLARQIDGHVSMAEYLTLARDHQWSGLWEEAERCYKRAVAKAKSTDTRGWALRALASSYYSSPKRDLAKGRAYYRKSCEVFKNPDQDAYAAYLLGLAYETWALSEYGLRCFAEGDEALAQAKKVYEIWPNYSLCKSSRDALDAKVEMTIRAAA